MERDKNGKFVKGHKVNLGIRRTQEFKHDVSLRVRGKNNVMYGKLGKDCPNWSGGKTKHTAGYVEIYNRNHPHTHPNGYVLEHRLVMEKYLGRYLEPKEQVHHINGIKDDNRIKNLKLFSSNSEHRKYHHHKISDNNLIIV